LRKQPKFLIVGALKAGTTTLASELIKHPEIGMPIKEIHFFNKKLDKGIDWYERQYGACLEQVVGEATPTYGYHPHIPALIKNHYPHIKIIWILRDPVYRVYSNYWHVRKQFHERRTFADAITSELNCQENNMWRLYCDRSRYADQIYRFQCYFPPGQIHVVLLEELIADFARKFSEVLAFLGVDDIEFLPGEAPEQGNQTRIPRALGIQRVVKSVLPAAVVPAGIRKFWPRQKMDQLDDPTIIGRLSEYFAEPNRQLEQLLDRPITCWKTFVSGRK